MMKTKLMFPLLMRDYSKAHVHDFFTKNTLTLNVASQMVCSKISLNISGV